jgi:hypothetical protein
MDARKNIMKSIMLLICLGFLTLSTGCTLHRVTTYSHEKPDDFPVLRSVGYGIVDVQPGPTRSEKVLQAIRASRLDAYRELTEQVYGNAIQADTRYNDNRQVSNQLHANVDGLLRGARVVKSYPVNNMYATELELDTRVLYNLYQMDRAY